MDNKDDVISLINCPGYKNLLKPYLEDQISENLRLFETKRTTEEEDASRAVILVYRQLIALVDEWVDDVNKKKDGGEE